jgi:ComF family protein
MERSAPLCRISRLAVRAACGRLPGLLDLVFPRTCIRCGALIRGREGAFTCAACRAGYPLIRDPFCAVCGAPFHGVLAAPGCCEQCRAEPPRFERARSLFLYRGTGARLVHALKYERATWLESEITDLLRADPQWRAALGGAALIPVPLHPRKERARGYNQAAVIARAMQRAIPQTTCIYALRRVRPTASQTLLSRTERRRNLSRAFACVNPPPADRPLVLVDDVLTTGATLNAACAALQQAGAKRISAFTLAHG